MQISSRSGASGGETGGRQTGWSARSTRRPDTYLRILTLRSFLKAILNSGVLIDLRLPLE
jgi:hypothetical protein